MIAMEDAIYQNNATQGTTNKTKAPKMTVRVAKATILEKIEPLHVALHPLALDIGA